MCVSWDELGWHKNAPYVHTCKQRFPEVNNNSVIFDTTLNPMEVMPNHQISANHQHDDRFYKHQQHMLGKVQFRLNLGKIGNLVWLRVHSYFFHLMTTSHTLDIFGAFRMCRELNPGGRLQLLNLNDTFPVCQATDLYCGWRGLFHDVRPNKFPNLMRISLAPSLDNLSAQDVEQAAGI